MVEHRSPDYDDKTDEAPVPNNPHASSHVVLEPNEARGGMTHHNVRYVLAIGLGLVVLAFIGVYVAFFVGGSAPTITAP
jgi:hypothetical protein